MLPSIRARFAFTVGANLLRSLLGFATGMLLARWLGPKGFGDMAFLLGTFMGLRVLLDMGSSTAFFTFLSQRPRAQRFVLSYFAWMTIQFVVTLLLIGLLFPEQWIHTVWRGEQRGLVLLAFAAAFLQNSVWPVVQQVGESQRKTFIVQTAGVVIVATHFIAIAVLWWIQQIGLYLVFAAIALEYFLACLVILQRLKYVDSSEAGMAPGIAAMLRMYLVYCLPMVPYSAVAFGHEFADKWLLQAYGGGVQQAYYAVGAQFAAIAMIATSSILRIFWKEVAEAHHQKNYARAEILYRKVSRFLFLVGALVAGALMPWSAELLQLVLGSSYAAGAVTLAIMFLYPIHQSMGQIGSTMLYATERVSLHSAIGIVVMLASIVVSYFILAPAGAPVPGLGMASEGLAIKMVLMQIISVNLIAYIIARVSKWRFDWLYQPVSLGTCCLAGWLARQLAEALVGRQQWVLLDMAVAGMIYAILMSAFIFWQPWVAGATRAELIGDLRRLFPRARTV
jgi:O-antigen/teichoic acid export membrane protein